MARVEITIVDHVAEVALARPDKMNALDPAMFAEIAAAGETLKGNRDVRAVVLYGQGPSFCAGLDFQSFQSMGSDMASIGSRLFDLSAGEVANMFQKPAYVWQELEVPVIAALSGVAFGGGCQIALAADIRIAAPDARLSVMEIKWGLVPDMGLTQSIRRLVRADVAKDLVLTGRIVGAQEACDLGLVTRIAAEPLAAARALAREIADKSPDATRRIKQLIDRSWQATPAEGLRLEATLQHEVIGQPNQIEAVRANFEKRKPVFR